MRTGSAASLATTCLRRYILGPMSAKDFIGYQGLIDRALRGVVRDALAHAAKGGIMGGHFFNIVFDTRAPGVEIPDHLREKFPDAMKIILQNQYWDLKVNDEAFEVTLSFSKMPATIVVPFAALLAFEDPSQKFELRFLTQAPLGKGALLVKKDAPPPVKIEPGKPPEPPPSPTPPEPGAVVSLDKFRKK